MFRRQPLRFLLADDPGAGKTIMAGLVHQGADDPRRPAPMPGRLSRQPGRAVAGRAATSKFDLRFDILTRERIEACAHRQLGSTR